MSFLQFQTASVRIFRLNDPTDRDLAKLQHEFPLHPHDAEAILHPAAQPAFDQYSGTSLLRWPWAQFIDRANDFHGAEMTLLWRGNDVVVVTHEASGTADACVNDVLRDDAAATFGSPMDVVAELLWRSTTAAQETVKAFFQALSPTSSDTDARRLQHLFTQQSDMLTNCLAKISDMQEPNRLRLKLVAHQLKHLSKDIELNPRPVMRSLDAPVALMPKVATGYMLASAAIVAFVLIASAA